MGLPFQINNEKGRLIAKGALLFLASFSLFLWLQSSPSFIDPDSFFHTKMALLMKDGHFLLKQFPWLQLTVLKDNFTDQHFLYHLLLIPFVSMELFSPVFGVKLATALFASFAAVIFFLILRSQKIAYALPWTLLLLVQSPFLFRLSLPKANALSMCLLLIGISTLFKKNRFFLFSISFLYVWTHGSFPLIAIAAFLFDLSTVTAQPREKGFPFKNSLISLSGIACGIIFNPYFPQNLEFYRYQIFEIAVRGYTNIIQVGAEWYPYDFFDLLGASSLLWMALLFALLSLPLALKKKCRGALPLFGMGVLLFGMTLRSSRNVEYFIPIALLFSAMSINSFIAADGGLAELRKFLEEFFRKRKTLLYGLAVFSGLFIPFAVIRDITSVKKTLDRGFPITKFKSASEWLSTHSEPGTILFHSHWDMFPILFFHNSNNFYLGGLDPVFTYLKNKTAYEAWQDIGDGRKTGEEFNRTYLTFFSNAKFAFVEKNRDIALNARLKWSKLFEKVYEDEESIIYEQTNYNRSAGLE
jgi:hypothetical protein